MNKFYASPQDILGGQKWKNLKIIKAFAAMLKNAFTMLTAVIAK